VLAAAEVWRAVDDRQFDAVTMSWPASADWLDRCNHRSGSTGAAKVRRQAPSMKRRCSTACGTLSVLYSRLHIGSAHGSEARRLTAEDIEALDMLGRIAATPNAARYGFHTGDIQFLHTIRSCHCGRPTRLAEVERKRICWPVALAPGRPAAAAVFAECYGASNRRSRRHICKGTRLPHRLCRAESRGCTATVALSGWQIASWGPTDPVMIRCVRET